jgi:hypothetical protein
MLEQGSGACLWRPGDNATPEQLYDSCKTAFDIRTSDHDIEVFVPTSSVRQAQGILDTFVQGEYDNPASTIHRIGPLTLYSFSKEAFESGRLLIGTPLNTSGDGSGDLAMGRQILLLLWLLEGEYVTGVPSFQPRALGDILDDLKNGRGGAVPLPGEPTGIPRLEGFEWSLLQEFNFYKSGALLRIARLCETGSGVDPFLSRNTNAHPNDPEQNFEERGLFSDDCVDQLRTVGKAGIRTVMARLVAHAATNPTVLDVTLDGYRQAECRTEVDDIRLPPATPDGYGTKPCGSFEEYIASKAIESVAENRGVFEADELPLIFRFYCAKVGQACKDRHQRNPRLLPTDDDLNRFVTDTIGFIEETQQLEYVTQSYTEGLSNDSDPIGNLPSLSFIRTLCDAHGVTGVTTTTPRSRLRECNREIVSRKVNGDPAVVVGQPLPFDIVADEDRRKALAKRFGVRNMVFKNLRVRAVNRGGLAVSNVLTKVFEGDGLTVNAYRDLDVDYLIDRLPGATARVIEDMPTPAGRTEPLYRAVFWVERLPPNSARAITYFIDPDRQIPEADKRDNSAGFFYYRLDRTAPVPPVGLPEQPVPPIEDLGPDPLCTVPSGLALTLVAKHLSSVGPADQKEMSIVSGQSIELQYTVTNRGSQPVNNLSVRRTHANGPVLQGGTIPGATAGVESSLRQSEIFTAREPGIYEIVARAAAFDQTGNTLTAGPSHVRVTVREAPCSPRLTVLDADPNTHDDHGRPFSSVMLGGRFFRYYRLLGADGEPLSGVALSVQKRELPGGAFVNLEPVFTGAEGLIVHPAPTGTGVRPGLRLTAAGLGSVGIPFEVRVFPGESFSQCGVSFRAEVTPRQFSASIKAGAAIEAEGAIEVNLNGRAESGFELKLDREVTQGGTITDQKITFNRSMNAELGVGLRFATTKAGVTAGDELSIGKVDPTLNQSAILGLRDRHEFDPPIGLTEGAMIGQLVVGLVAVSATAGTPTPAGPMLSLALNELFERLGGTAQHRRGVGGSAGMKVRAGISARGLDIKVTNTRKLTASVDATIDAAAIGSIDLLMPAQADWLFDAALEYRARFNGRVAIGSALSDVLQGDDLAPDERTNLASSVDMLLALFQANGAADLAGTFKLSALLDLGDLSDPRVRGITASISHQKRYGFNVAGFQIIEAPDPGNVKKITFRITDRDPAKLRHAIATLTMINALKGLPADLESGEVLLGPALTARELVKLLTLADEYDERIERVRAFKYPFGLEFFMAGVGADVGIELKLDSGTGYVTSRGTLRRSKRFPIEEYDENDALIPESEFDRAVEFLRTVPDRVKTFVQDFRRTTAVVSVGPDALLTLITWLFGEEGGVPQQANTEGSGPFVGGSASLQDGGPGVRLEIDGASEPQTFDVELIAFQFRSRPADVGLTPNDPAAVRGPPDQPHYGIGGFFNFAPNERVLARPARLTIHYSDSEVAAFDEATLGIYRWNNVTQDWDHRGGTVDAVQNRVSVDVDRLGLYTVAPAMPAGAVVFTPQMARGGSDTAPTTVITFTSAPLRLNTGATVSDGTLFTVRPILGETGDEIPIGQVLTVDAAPALPGIQVASQNGIVTFVAELPGAIGTVVPLAFSVHGTAIADRVFSYQRPQ